MVLKALINRKMFLLLLIILVSLFACKKPSDPVKSDIVINELLPVNTSIVPDQNGEYDDWIELYNLSNSVIDISGYFLSDNKDNFSKWELPSGTSIPGNGYLIIWADKDSAQVGLHANFKLSSQGEEVLLSKPDGTLIDKVIYPGQTLQLSFSRNPDGTGSFRWQTPTYNSSNNISE
jgi:Lamin Tail Domain